MESRWHRYFRMHRADKLSLLFMLLFAGGGVLFFLGGHSQASSPQAQYTESHSDSLQPKPLYIAPRSQEQAPHPTYTRQRKLPKGVTIALNEADSLALLQVPGIGPSTAKRILHYRKLLGGYYTTEQLQEVYSIRPEQYEKIRPYFRLGTAPQRRSLRYIPYDSIPYHPYLSRSQREALARILYYKGSLQGWSELSLLPEFDRDDSIRLSYYFSF